MNTVGSNNIGGVANVVDDDDDDNEITRFCTENLHAANENPNIITPCHAIKCYPCDEK